MSEYWGWTSDIGVSERNFCDMTGGTEFCDVTEERKGGRTEESNNNERRTKLEDEMKYET
jgi:hypothetical protein